MKKLGYLIASIGILFSTNSFASGIFIEPAVTFQTGTDKVHYSAPFSDSDETVRAMVLD